MSADYPSMTTAEIRSKFLTFFEERGLKLYPSSSLVPDDPSLLLANAGMNQFKEYYQGKKTMKEIGAISCQKCVRTNDIDCIGEDGRHLSFFEMLGDFSFGGVSKQQACAWAFELITKEFKLPLDRLYFTVFTEDDETHDVWRSLGVAEDHISRLGEDDNFWAAGPTGPCGPCSEIYFDMGEEVGCGSPDCKPGCDCDRFLEFWNLVFTQYDRQEDGSMPELPHRNLDTGMGLERMAAIMQHKTANYDGDLMQHLIKLGEEISGKTYDADDYSGASRSLRIIADHSRAVDFMISDGILPGNEGREYVLRRLLRRAVFHGRLLGIEGAFLTKFIDEVNAQMGEAYPELLKNVALVKGIVASEEERFSTTLDNGRVYLDEALAALADGAVLPGDVAFKLHDTFGFPIDLTLEMVDDEDMTLDQAGFEKLMQEQKVRAREARKALGDLAWAGIDLGLDNTPTKFVGYDVFNCESKVLAICVGDEVSGAISGGESGILVLDKTPFYAEMGGQVADTGVIMLGESRFEVTNVQKDKGGKYLHYGKLNRGTIHVEDIVCASIDVDRRKAIMRAHSATHLLQKALSSVLGDHVHQAGSLVEPDYLRFDFTHYAPMTREELNKVNSIVQNAILEGYPIVTREMPIEEAKKLGATALFSEKYGDVVRVVNMSGYSVEFCGGTHLDNTAKVGPFEIESEGSVASGVRRIEAYTGKLCLKKLETNRSLLTEAAGRLKVKPMELAGKLQGHLDEIKELRKVIEQYKAKEAAGDAERFLFGAHEIGGLKVMTVVLPKADAAKLRQMGDMLRDREPGVVAVLASVKDEKPTFLAVCGKEAVKRGIKAGELVKLVCTECGGCGGGKPDSAMGGGKDPVKVDNALALVDDFVSQKV